jgi:uncharacterized repeat protein (TIGR03803 family)
LRVALLLVIITLVWALAPTAGAASKFEVLYKFYGYQNGAFPSAGLTYDSAGNLYGTTTTGSSNHSPLDSDAFELTPNSDGSWTEGIIYTFTGGPQGYAPQGTLIFDSAGNLYGTMSEGGINGNSGSGLVYELSPNGDGTWTDTVLYNLGSDDGAYPGAVIFGAAGNLYGITTDDGGNTVGGTVFQLTPKEHGTWTFATLYNFCSLKYCRDGGAPVGGLTFDSAGNLYGTTEEGGEYADGVVFELTPTTKGLWNEKVLHQFVGGSYDGAVPLGGVTFDSNGRLYGTTLRGGRTEGSCDHGCGVVFKLVKDSQGVWHEGVIHKLSPAAAFPQAGLVFNGRDLFGASFGNGNGANNGVVFEVVP